MDFSTTLDRSDYPKAVEIIQKYEEPIAGTFQRLGGHAAFRAARELIGQAESRQDRFPLRTLGKTEVKEIETLLNGLDIL